jgi:hypothetical protein
VESVYIETSVVSYLVARPPARTLAHQWHVWTKDWWRLRRPYFECMISPEVLREAAAGDPKASRQRLETLSTLMVQRFCFPKVSCDKLAKQAVLRLKSLRPGRKRGSFLAWMTGRQND